MLEHTYMRGFALDEASCELLLHLSMSVVRYNFKMPYLLSLSLLQRLNSKFVSCCPSFNTSRGACTNIWTHQFSYFNNSLSVTSNSGVNIPLKNLYHISNVNIFFCCTFKMYRKISQLGHVLLQFGGCWSCFFKHVFGKIYSFL